MCKGGVQVLSKEQEELITFVIIGEKITDIAKKLNRSRQTIYEWLSRDEVKVELDRRKQELARQGNNYILKDLYSYIDNIKALANDRSDKRVCLAANQYLINRIYGNPTNSVEVNTNENDNNSLSETELEQEINRIKFKLVK
jgi:hypothetical protein